MSIESSCIFRFGFTFPGCKYVLPHFGQADLRQGVADVLGGRMPLLSVQACLTRSQRNILPLSFSLSEQGVSNLEQGNKGSGRQEKGLGDLQNHRPEGLLLERHLG